MYQSVRGHRLLDFFENPTGTGCARVSESARNYKEDPEMATQPKAVESQEKTESQAGQKDIREKVSTLFEGAQKKVQDVTERVVESTSEMAKGAREAASKALENVESMIQRHPIQAFLIGLAVGGILGLAITSGFMRRST